MKIHSVNEILTKLESCILNDIPFSHIRFGDGGIKYMAAVLRGDSSHLSEIMKKEGMPNDRIIEILDLWGYYARQADYIDCPQVYYDGFFWPRVNKGSREISKSTDKKMINWRDLYSRCEIDNENYCNPESNYLMTIRFIKKRKNILDVMKGRKVCIITAKPEIKEQLIDVGYDIDIVPIVGQYENQYKYSFNNVVSRIQETATKYDFWLTAAGELGRIYSGIIKECGGRTIDIGFIIEFWLGENLHPRLAPFLRRNRKNYLETKLHDKGGLFARYI